MRRKLSFIALVLLSAVASACAAPTAPTSNEEPCAVVAGTQTRCDSEKK